MAFRFRRRQILAGAAATAAAPVIGLSAAAAAQAAPGASSTELGGGSLAEVRGGSREKMWVRLDGAAQDIAVPTRGFSADWDFLPGDLVVVQPAASGRVDQGIAEPFTHVVRLSDRMEVWVANVTEGPRLAAVVPTKA